MTPVLRKFYLRCGIHPRKSDEPQSVKRSPLWYRTEHPAMDSFERPEPEPVLHEIERRKETMANLPLVNPRKRPTPSIQRSCPPDIPQWSLLRLE